MLSFYWFQFLKKFIRNNYKKQKLMFSFCYCNLKNYTFYLELNKNKKDNCYAGERWRDLEVEKERVLAYTPQFSLFFPEFLRPSHWLLQIISFQFFFSPPFFYNQIPQSFFLFVFSNFKSFFEKIPSNFPVFSFSKHPLK